MNFFELILSSTNRWFVLVCTVCSMGLGMLWFGKPLFGALYGKRMGLPPMDPHAKDMDMPGLMNSLVRESASRVLFFVGVEGILNIIDPVRVIEALCIVVTLRALFILSTQVSMVTRSTADKKVLLLIGGKMMIDSVVAVVFRMWVF